MKPNIFFLDKIAVVTGGGSGLGRSLCLLMCNYGSTVVCADIDIRLADETAAMAGEMKGNIIAEHLDVSDNEMFTGLIDRVVTRYGRIDIIINNAGISARGEIRDLEIRHWRKTIETNLFGTINGSIAAYRVMTRQGYGNIVNICSILGRLRNQVLTGPYSVSKHAITSFTKTLILESRALGIKTHLVSPGFISSDFTSHTEHVNSKGVWKEKITGMMQKGIKTDKAAKKIIVGIAKNRKQIIFPFYVRILILFSRILPFAERMVSLKILKDFRHNDRFD